MNITTDVYNDTGEFEYEDIYGKLKIPFIVVLLTCTVVGFLGNMMTMVTISISKSLQTVPNFFIFNLSAADITLILANMPLSTLYLIKSTSNHHFLECKYIGPVNIITMLAGLHTIGFLIVNRYQFLSQRPGVYRAYSSRSWVLKNVAGIWLWSAFIACPPFIFGLGTYGFHHKSHTCFIIDDDEQSYLYIALFLCALGLFPLIVLVAYCFLRMLLLLRKEMKIVDNVETLNTPIELLSNSTVNQAQPSDTMLLCCVWCYKVKEMPPASERPEIHARGSASLTIKARELSPIIMEEGDYGDVPSKLEAEQHPSIHEVRQRINSLTTSIKRRKTLDESKREFAEELLEENIFSPTSLLFEPLLGFPKQLASYQQSSNRRSGEALKRDGVSSPLREQLSYELPESNWLEVKSKKVPEFIDSRRLTPVLQPSKTDTPQEVRPPNISRHSVKAKVWAQQKNYNNSSNEKVNFFHKTNSYNEINCLSPTRKSFSEQNPKKGRGDKEKLKLSPMLQSNKKCMSSKLENAKQRDCEQLESSPEANVNNCATTSKNSDKLAKKMQKVNRFRKQMRLLRLTSQIQATKMLFWIFVITAGGWLPFLITTLVDHKNEIEPIIYASFVVLGWLSSCLKVFFYCKFNIQLRNAYLDLLCCRHKADKVKSRHIKSFADIYKPSSHK